jgi:chromosome segregation ATPase
MATTERESLELHVDLCHLRYQQLEHRVTTLEKKIDTVSEEVKELATNTQQGFDDIKKMLSKNNDERFKVMITTTGTIIVGLLGLLGYVILHLPK